MYHDPYFALVTAVINRAQNDIIGKSKINKDVTSGSNSGCDVLPRHRLARCGRHFITRLENYILESNTNEPDEMALLAMKAMTEYDTSGPYDYRELDDGDDS